MNMLDWRRSFYAHVGATKFEHTDVAVVDKHYADYLDERVNQFIPENTVDLALRDMGWFVAMFPFDRCIDRVRGRMECII